MRVSGFGDTQRQILVLLKQRGGAGVQELGEAVGLNAETVRAHVKALEVEGVVEKEGTRIRGRGRPEIVYGLTQAAERLFPRLEGTVLKELASYLLARDGTGLLDGFLREFFSGRLEEARERADGLPEPARLEVVAEAFSDLGFMAQVEGAGPDARLRLSHCPLEDLVSVTSIPCRREEEFLHELMGTELTRVCHRLAGDAACVYELAGRGAA